MDASSVTVIDQYSGFDHKAAMDSNHALGSVPGWVRDGETRRRLTATAIAKAYHENVARAALRDDSEIGKYWREFGDAAAVSDRIAAATIGDDLTFSVVGSDETLPVEPLVGPEPSAPEGSNDPVALRKAAAQRRVWEQQAYRAIDEWEMKQNLKPLLVDRQAWLRHWARTKRFEAIVRENESEQITPLGDGLIVFRCTTGELPEPELYPPDSYFPVWPEDGSQPEFPDKLHLAWEYEHRNDDGGIERWVRRITYELTDTDVNGDPLAEAEMEYGGRSDVTCLLSDGRWKLGEGAPFGLVGDLEDLNDSVAVWAESGEFDEDGEPILLNGFDLEIDFIPVVHFPSDLSTLTHFGRSVYLRLAQILDAVALNDTDTERAAALTGLPPIAMAGGRLEADADGKSRYHPGIVFNVEQNGGLAMIEMADNLRALVDRSKSLQQRLSSVSSVPEGVLGHVQANQIVSGVALLLTFTAFRQLVTRRRLARRPKLELCLRMVQKLAIKAGEPTILESGSDVYDCDVHFGAFIPTDVKLIVEVICQLADRGLMTETLAMTLVEAAGLEVGEIEVVVAELRARDFATAAEAMAVAGERYAQKWLGLDPDDPDVEKPEPVVTPFGRGQDSDVADADATDGDPAGEPGAS